MREAIKLALLVMLLFAQTPTNPGSASGGIPGETDNAPSAPVPPLPGVDV